PIAIATAQCLMVICEDERAYSKLIETNSSTSNLADVMSHIVNLDVLSSGDAAQVTAQMYLKSLIISILSCHHFKSIPSSTELSTAKEELLSKLSQIVDQVFGYGNVQSLNSLVGQLHEQMKQDLS